MEKGIVEKLHEYTIAFNAGYNFTPERLKIEYSDKDYKKIIKYVKSYAKTVNIDDIVIFFNSDFGIDGFKTGAVFTEEYMYGAHTPPIYLYGMKEVNILDKKSSKECSFMVVYESEKITGKIKGFYAAQLVYQLQSLVGQVKGVSTYDIRKTAREYIQEGNDTAAETLLESIYDEDGEAAGMLARHYYDTNPTKALHFTRTAKKLGHFLGYYMDGVHEINENKNLKKGYDLFLEAYERGMDGIEDDLIALHKAMLEVRPPFKREPYIYNSLNADPHMFRYIPNSSYAEVHYRFLSENNDDSVENFNWDSENDFNTICEGGKASTDFANYLIDTLNNGWKSINFNYHNEEEKKKGYFDSFCFHSNYLDSVIIDYCRFHTQFDVTNLPIMNMDGWEYSKMGIFNRLDIKSYLYEHAYEYPNYNIYAHLKSATARNLMTRLKDQKVVFSKKDNIAFIEDIILSYETVMTEHKKLVAPTLSILSMWNADTENKNDSARFDRYLEGAKQAVLSQDKQFLELKDKFCKKARISDSDLFQGDLAHYESIIKREKLKFIGRKLNLNDQKWYQLLTFEPYIYSYDEYFSIKRSVVKKHDKNLDISKTLFYYDKFMNDLNYVITDDTFYATCFPVPVPLKGLVCSKTTRHKQVVFLYDNGTEKVVTYPNDYEYKQMKGILWFLNRILIHL